MIFMNDTIPESQEGVKNIPVNLSHKPEIESIMKKKDRVVYSAMGGGLLTAGILLSVSALISGLKDNTSIFLVAVITGIIGFYLIYSIAYKQR